MSLLAGLSQQGDSIADHNADPAAHQSPIAFSVPAGLGWPEALCPLAPTLQFGRGIVAGSAGITPEALFNMHSIALSNPGVEYWVATTGSDGAAGTEGSPYATIVKAVTMANAAGVPARINVAAGSYHRVASPFYGIVPAVDLAFRAVGGRVVTGTWDQFSAPSVDGTHANTYSWALTGIQRVVDLTRRDRFGCYQELQYVATAALCNITPNSWAKDATTIFVRRGDGAAVTNANTRVYRASSECFKLSGAQISVYASGFDFEGGSSGALTTVYSSKPAASKALVFSGCTFRYPGGITNAGQRSVSVDSLHGVAAFFDCSADRAGTDGFNFHNTGGFAAETYALTVNCAANDNGEPGQTSCNGLTLHENVVAVDVAGQYEASRGGSIRNIGTSKHLVIGTNIVGDIGDLTSVPATGIRTDDTAQIWAANTEVRMPAGTAHWYARSGSTIRRRDCVVRGYDSGSGTFGTF